MYINHSELDINILTILFEQNLTQMNLPKAQAILMSCAKINFSGLYIPVSL